MPPETIVAFNRAGRPAASILRRINTTYGSGRASEAGNVSDHVPFLVNVLNSSADEDIHCDRSGLRIETPMVGSSAVDMAFSKSIA